MALTPAIDTTPSAEAREFKIVDVVGDSLGAGISADSASLSGWVQMLFGEGARPPSHEQTLAALWPRARRFNSAVSGSTAAQWAAPGSPYIERVLEHRPDLVLMMLGGNDFIRGFGMGTWNAAERLRLSDHLAAIITKLQAGTPRPEIVLIGYYDLFDNLSENIPATMAAFRAMSREARTANTMLRELAAERGCNFVDLRQAFLHRCYGRYLGDAAACTPAYVSLPWTSFDIHPTTAGHRAIYEAVFAALRRLKDERAPAAEPRDR